MRVLYHFFYKLQEKLKKSINIRFPTTIYTKKMKYTTLWILIFLLLYFICAQQALGFLYFLMVLVLVLPGNTRCKNFGWYPYHYFFNCIVYYIPQYKKLTFFTFHPASYEGGNTLFPLLSCGLLQMFRVKDLLFV